MKEEGRLCAHLLPASHPARLFVMASVGRSFPADWSGRRRSPEHPSRQHSGPNSAKGQPDLQRGGVSCRDLRRDALELPIKRRVLILSDSQLVVRLSSQANTRQEPVPRALLQEMRTTYLVIFSEPVRQLFLPRRNESAPPALRVFLSAPIASLAANDICSKGTHDW